MKALRFFGSVPLLLVLFACGGSQKRPADPAAENATVSVPGPVEHEVVPSEDSAPQGALVEEQEAEPAVAPGLLVNGFSVEDAVLGWRREWLGPRRRLPGAPPGSTDDWHSSDHWSRGTLIFEDGRGLFFEFPGDRGPLIRTFQLPEQARTNILERLSAELESVPKPAYQRREEYYAFVASRSRSLDAWAPEEALAAVITELERLRQKEQRELQPIDFSAFEQVQEERTGQLAARLPHTSENRAWGLVRGWLSDAERPLRHAEEVRPLVHETKGPGPRILTGTDGVVWLVEQIKWRSLITLILDDGQAFRLHVPGTVERKALSSRERERIYETFNKQRFFEFPASTASRLVMDGGARTLYAANSQRSHKAYNYSRSSRSWNQVGGALAALWQTDGWDPIDVSRFRAAVQAYAEGLPVADQRRIRLLAWLARERLEFVPGKLEP